MRRAVRPVRRHRQTGSIVEQRIESVRDVAERFSYGMAQLMAGRDDDLDDCADAALAMRMRSAMAPFLVSGERVCPDFGSFAELRVDGDLTGATPVDAVLEFEDRSLRETGDGRGLVPPRRRIALHLRMSLDPCMVQDCAVVVSAGRQ